MGDGELPAAAESRQVAGRNGDRTRGRRRVAAPASRLVLIPPPVTIYLLAIVAPALPGLDAAKRHERLP